MNNTVKILLLAFAALAMTNIVAAENDLRITHVILEEDLVEIYYYGDGTVSATVNNSITAPPHEVNITISDNAGGGTTFETTANSGWVGTTAYSMSCSDDRVSYANVVVKVNGDLVKDITIYKNKYCLEDLKVNVIQTKGGAYALNISVTNPNEKGIEADIILRYDAPGGDIVYSTRESLRPGNNTVTVYAQNPGQYEVLVDGDGMDGMAWQDVTIDPDRGFVWVIVALIIGAIIGVIGTVWLIRRGEAEED